MRNGNDRVLVPAGAQQPAIARAEGRGATALEGSSSGTSRVFPRMKSGCIVRGNVARLYGLSVS